MLGISFKLFIQKSSKPINSNLLIYCVLSRAVPRQYNILFQSIWFYCFSFPSEQRFR